MVVTPGNIIGLPVGVWALAVLSRKEVRESFGRGLGSVHRVRTGKNGGWKTALVIGLVALGAFLVLLFLLVISLFYFRASKVQHGTAPTPQISYGASMPQRESYIAQLPEGTVELVAVTEEFQWRVVASRRPISQTIGVCDSR